MYFYTFYMSERPPSGRERREALFPKAKKLLLHLRRKSIAPDLLNRAQRDFFLALDFSLYSSSYRATVTCVLRPCACTYMSNLRLNGGATIFFLFVCFCPSKGNFPSAGRDPAACAGFYARCETGACLHGRTESRLF